MSGHGKRRWCIPITKRKQEADGSLLVWGAITDDTLDSDGEIVDPDFAAKALTDWFNQRGAVFNQHAEFYPPAGKGIALEVNDGVASLRAKIIEPTAIQFVQEGVYKDFSVGWYDPEYVRDPQAPGGRMVGGWVREVSLVDAGSNNNSHIEGFVMAKSKRKGEAPRFFGVAQADTDLMARAVTRAMSLKAEQSLQAGRWYAALKRDMDPDVGGGVDRDKLPDSAFVFPDTRTFPIVSPADVEDAVQSWGRYKGPETFDTFKTKLIALAKRLGSSFVAKLPDSWDVTKRKKGKDDMAKKAAAAEDKPEGAPSDDMMECSKCKGEGTMDGAECSACGGKGKCKATKAAGSEDAPGDDTKQCPTCSGSGKIMDGHRKCPDCEGSGKVPANFTKAAKEAAPKAVAAKQDDDDDDDVVDAPDDGANGDVDDAIDDLMEDVMDAAQAQADDEGDEPATPEDAKVSDAIDDVGDAVAALAAAQAADETSLATNGGVKAKARRTKTPPAPAATKAAAEPAPAAVEPAAEAEPVKVKKAKAPKERKVPAEVLAAHDALCPVFPADERALKAIDPGWFLDQFRRRDAAGKSDAGRAYDDAMAANKVSLLEPPTFARLRAVAHKVFASAYPDLSAAGFTLTSPDQFKRPFLSSATGETSSTSSVPNPSMAASFGPEDFTRGPLPDEARPTLATGVSASKGAKKKKKGGKHDADSLPAPTSARVFYTNAGKDEHAGAMALLHDHIANNYPGICPMHAAKDVSGDDGHGAGPDGLLGQPDEQYQGAPKPVALPVPGAHGPDMIEPARTGMANKAAKADTQAPVEGTDVDGQLDKALKALAKSDRRNAKLKARQKAFEKKVTEQLRLPDPRRAANRGTQPGNFAPKAVTAGEDPERVRHARERINALKTRLRSPNSATATEATEELRDLVSPDQFAKLLTDA